MRNKALSEAEVLSIEIMVDGQKLKDTDTVSSIEVERILNRIATAKVTLLLSVDEGDNTTFARSEAKDLLPGRKIEIKAGLVDSTKTLFKGIITHHGIRNIGGKINELILRCSDEAVKMTLTHKTECYEKMKDSAIIGKVVNAYGGLSASVDDTGYEHKQLVKYHCNDWDFVVGRAEANGLLVYTEDGKVYVKKPTASGSPNLTVDFGRDVLSYELGLEARFQTPSTTCKAWDMKTQALVEGKSGEPSLSKHGNLKGDALGKDIGFTPDTFLTTAPLDRSELKNWADAQTLKARLSTLQGSVTFLGSEAPKLNSLLKITGFGDRFNSEGLVTNIRHTVRNGLWQTTVGLGLPPEWHYTQRPVSAPPAGGLLPAIGGLQNGVVKQIDSDPDGEFRVLVNVPVIEPAGKGIWARLSHFYATNGKGSFFMPEKGDEVVLGFLNDDPRFPVILGMLYSSKKKPAYTPDDKNKIKAIVTKNDLKIEFNDEDKVLTIKTPGGNEFVLSDKDKSITLKDQNGNKMEMNNSGITFDSPKDVSIKSKGKISLDAVSGITAKASGGDVGLEGLNVNAKAKIAFSAQGTATAELKASGQTSVKGAMVMIN